MIKRVLFLLFATACLSLSAQTAISGYVNMKDSENWEQKVYLTKLDIAHLKDLKDLKYAKAVAWSPIKADGSFSFEQKHIADKNAVYHLYVNRTEKALRDTIANATAFILSSADTMRFYKGDELFSDYSTTNLADQEWKRLREFEKQVFRSQLTEEDVSQLKSYAKDSLRILIVKLIGIRIVYPPLTPPKEGDALIRASTIASNSSCIFGFVQFIKIEKTICSSGYTKKLE